MTENQREAAQLHQRDEPGRPSDGREVLMVVEVVGELDLVRGFQARTMRPATAEDVKRLAPKRRRPRAGGAP